MPVCSSQKQDALCRWLISRLDRADCVTRSGRVTAKARPIFDAVQKRSFYSSLVGLHVGVCRLLRLYLVRTIVLDKHRATAVARSRCLFADPVAGIRLDDIGCLSDGDANGVCVFGGRLRLLVDGFQIALSRQMHADIASIFGPTQASCKAVLAGCISVRCIVLSGCENGAQRFLRNAWLR